MSPRLLCLLIVASARRDLAYRRGAWDGLAHLAQEDARDLETAEWRGYGRPAAGDAMIRRGA
jgi:hypothetical protein